MEAKNLGDIFFPLVAQELTAKRKGERNYPAKQVVRLGRDGGSNVVGRGRFSKDEAGRIAANIAKLPELLRKP